MRFGLFFNVLFLPSNKTGYYLILKILVFLFLGHHSFGQDKQISFRKLTVEDGLSQNSIISIAQDSLGVMWFATQDGLNRYDGLKIEKFDEYFDDVTKPNYSRLGKVFIDHNDNVWLITKTGKLKKYSSHNFKSREIKTVKDANFIYQDHLHQLIVGTWNNGIYIVEPGSLTIKTLSQVNDIISGDTINSIIQDEEKRYWIGTSSGLYYLDNLEASLEKVDFTDPVNPASISTLTIDRKGRLWAGTYKNGLFYKDTDNRLLKAFRFTDKDNDLPVGNKINILCLWVDHKDRLWVGTYGDGLILISNDGNIENFTLHRNNPNSISYNDILHLYQDSNKVIWAGTDGGGVSFYDENLYKFNSVTNSDVHEDIHVDVIRSIIEGEENSIWLGTSGYGLTIYDPAKADNWRTLNTGNSNLSNDRIMSLSKDNNQKIWIGTQGGGLDIFDLKTKQFENYYNNKKPSYLPDHTIWTIYHDLNNRHWIGTRDHGLCLFDEEKGVLKKYVPNNAGIPGRSIRVIIQEDENTLWIGTENNGFCRFIIDKEEFNIYKFGDTDNNSVSSNLIKSLYYSEGLLWIGTSGGGLNVLDIEQNEFRVFKVEDGLPNNVIYSILPDEDSNLWLSTNMGLSKFTPPESLADNISLPGIINYDNYDGLQGLEFNTGAHFKDKAGNLYFGGINGYNWFNPKDIIINENSSKAIINNFEVNGVFQQLDTIISRKKTIPLKYNENAISFSFSTLNYSMPQRNIYKYKLKGYDNEWISSGFRNYVSYTNLAPGSYNFCVIGGNYDGVFHEIPTELQIIIYPPWWQTTWAYSLAFIILISSVFSIYRFQQNRWKLQTQLEMERQEAGRLMELDLFKSRLYANITHEFRTPLTVILGLIEKGREYFSNSDIIKFNNIIDIVQRNANGLLNLVNQMLDLSRLESKAIHLNMVNADVISFLKNLVGMYESHAENHNLALHFKSNVPELHMDYDPDNLQKIVSNIISNSIKFTDSGSVIVSVDEKFANDKKHVLIKIKDTGIGIAEEDLPSIFDRFFQAKNSKKKSLVGSGIGMALVKELVELMDGQVSINSQLGIGTEVIFSLPISSKEKPTIHSKRIFAKEIFETNDLQVEPNSATKSEGKAIVLTIEDNKDVQYYLNTCLQDNYQIINASDGDEGISIAMEYVPDIIISDVMMPGKTGYEVCEILKQDTRTSHIPIILLTAKAEIRDKISGIKHGADAYLIKPFNVDELLAQVENRIRSREILIEKFGKIEFNGNKPPIYAEKENEFLRDLNNLISQELSNPELNVDKVCAELHMSRTQLHRKIKALTNKSITAYIRSFRLQEAKKLIQNSNLTIQQIAFETGFSDSSYFHRSFVREFSKKPTDFRS